MTDYTDLSLKNFFIYNVLYGQKEGEEEKKIMFFYPKDTNIDLQIKDVGLSEAIVKFSETFSSETCDALQTEKTRRLFFQPEKNFWMVLTINVPTNKKGKDGLDGIEYRGGEIQNTVYSAVLRQSYFMAKLFIGPFMQLVESQEGDTELLRRRLDKFFSLYLSTLRLKNCDILDVFQGVRFLPLDKTIFLHAQCFVNVIEASFPVIDYSVFLYEDELIWSGLPPEDLQVIFKYITSSLLPSFREEYQIGFIPQKDSKKRFVTGPTNVDDVTFSGKVPKVYLSSVHQVGFYHLIVYQVGGAVLCIFIDSKQTLDMNFYREFDDVVKNRMLEVTGEVGSNRQRSEKGGGGGGASCGTDWGDESTRFVYFNRMNLATKTTVHQRRPNTSTSETTVTKETLRILVDIHNAHLRLADNECHSGETIVKTRSDRWIVGKLSNCREFYVTVDRKKANLIDISDEVDKICDRQLKDIFFHM